MAPELVPPDTQATLLLCGDFAPGGPKPLNLTEYNALAAWLLARQRRPASLLSDEGLPPDGEPALPERERLRALLARGVPLAAVLERWHRMGLWVVSRAEASYPERVRRVLRHQAPPVLYGVGDRALLARGGLAVVGSRDADEDGLEFARRVGRRCAGEGTSVVSGGARGVDREAASAALAAGGVSVGALAERLDQAATAGENRGMLRDGRLALVTPYEPDAHFAVGRAMGRNKLIYALADFGLVVRFTPEDGGTWAGAVERLSANRGGAGPVPVFVRRQGNDEAGLRELIDRGAAPFPEEALDGLMGCLARAARAASPAQAGPLGAPEEEAPAAPSPAPAAESAETFYSRCLPLLQRALREQSVGQGDLARLAERLQVQPGQLKVWLSRAVAEGAVVETKHGRKKVYRPAAQAALDSRPSPL